MDDIGSKDSILMQLDMESLKESAAHGMFYNMKMPARLQSRPQKRTPNGGEAPPTFCAVCARRPPFFSDSAVQGKQDEKAKIVGHTKKAAKKRPVASWARS